MGRREVGAGAVLLLVAAAAATLRCSLLAPSDHDLMGGGGSSPDASNDARLDAACVGTSCLDSGTVDAACARIVEVCTDGIDNNCNGLTDCADPACTAGFACEPNAPSGWVEVAFDPSSTAACPAGFSSMSTTVKVATPAGTNPCSCRCTVQGQDCTQGDFQVSWSFGTCPPPDAGSMLTLQAQTSCSLVPGTPSFSNSDSFVVQPPSGPTGCGASPVSGFPPVTTGRICTTLQSGGGCSGGQTCEARALPPYLACVAAVGDQSCPAGFSQQYVVGTSVDDNRACGPCSCGVTACTGTVSMWGNAGCSSQADLTAPADGTCSAQANHNFTAKGYEAVVTDGGCAVTAPSTPIADAGLVWTNEQTICCP